MYKIAHCMRDANEVYDDCIATHLKHDFKKNNNNGKNIEFSLMLSKTGQQGYFHLFETFCLNNNPWH